MPEIEKFYKEIADRIKTERLKKRITQEDLGEVLELSRASVINLEKGRHRPSIYQLILISRFLKVDYNRFIPVSSSKPKAKKNAIGMKKDLSKMINDQDTLNSSSRAKLLNFLSSVEK